MNTRVKNLFIFTASFLFGEAQREIRKRGIDTTLVLLAEYGEVIAERQARFIAMPAHSISIANILNGVNELRGYNEDKPGIRFTALEARVLIVDDIGLVQQPGWLSHKSCRFGEFL